MRCLEKDPSWRYSSVIELARDLEWAIRESTLRRGVRRIRENVAEPVARAARSLAASAPAGARRGARAAARLATPPLRWLRRMIEAGLPLPDLLLRRARAGVAFALLAVGMRPVEAPAGVPIPDPPSMHSMSFGPGQDAGVPNLTIIPLSLDSEGREMARMVLTDRVQIGDCAYPLRRPLRGVYRSVANGPGEFRVDAEGLEIIGAGATAREAVLDWRLRLHAVFQGLYAKLDFEMTGPERRLWNALRRTIDVEKYESNLPLVVRDVGRVIRMVPGPPEVEWLDGNAEQLHASLMPAEFAGYEIGQWFEALMERDPAGLSLRKALEVRRISPVVPLEGQALQKFWDSARKTSDLPPSSRDWTQ